MKVKEGEMTVDENKISKIVNLKAPTNIREIRGFLGMASYYRKYI